MPDSSSHRRQPWQLRYMDWGSSSAPIQHAPNMEGEWALAAALDDEYDFPVCHSDWFQCAIGKNHTPQAWMTQVLETALRACGGGHNGAGH